MVDDPEVGVRLKMVRGVHGLSQRKLAARSNVGNATISQIESGKLNPTIAMLKKVLAGIPISLAEFFAADIASANTRVFFSAKDLVEISEGGVRYRQVGGNLVGRAIQMLQETYQPGAGTGRIALKHEGEECGIILEGELTVTVGETTKTLAAGEAYYFKSDLPHSFANKGAKPCTLISACTPPTF